MNPSLFNGGAVPLMVHSVFTTISTSFKLSACRRHSRLCLEGWRSASFIGIVAFVPVPTIRPIATLLFGRDLTVYAREARVATVSLVIAAIFRRGSLSIFLLFAG